jgi:hypothetical protein
MASSIEHGSFGFAQVVMHMRGDRPARLVHDFPDARKLDFLALGDKNDLVLGLCAKIASEMQILARKVLVYTKHFHRATIPVRR